MTRLDALKSLAEKVGAGALPLWDRLPVDVAEEIGIAIDVDNNEDAWADVVEAYQGSLNAAKALHEAMLPEWFWGRQGFVMKVTEDHTGWGSKPHFSARHDTNPARAWLLAILHALIAQEKAQ